MFFSRKLSLLDKNWLRLKICPKDTLIRSLIASNSLFSERLMIQTELRTKISLDFLRFLWISCFFSRKLNSLDKNAKDALFRSSIASNRLFSRRSMIWTEFWTKIQFFVWIHLFSWNRKLIAPNLNESVDWTLLNYNNLLFDKKLLHSVIKQCVFLVSCSSQLCLQIISLYWFHIKNGHLS